MPENTPEGSQDAAADELPHLQLRLFVLRDTTKSTVAIRNLRRILDAEASGRYTLEIIDVRENPELAEEERILATPTLVRVRGSSPTPVHRIIGDMSDTEKVLMGLGIGPTRSQTTRGLR